MRSKVARKKYRKAAHITSFKGRLRTLKVRTRLVKFFYRKISSEKFQRLSFLWHFDLNQKLKLKSRSITPVVEKRRVFGRLYENWVEA